MGCYPGINKIVLLFVMLAIPLSIFAMGGKETDEAYGNELAELFNDTVTELDNREISLEQAKDAFKKLRATYSMGYTDESGVIDSMLDRVYEGSLSIKETTYYFALMQENRLSEYRTASYQKRLNMHQKELLELILSMIEQNSTGISAENLRNTLNNYYELFGLRYGPEYRMLTDLFIFFEEGNISLSSLRTRLTMMQKDMIDVDSDSINASTANIGAQGHPDNSDSGGNSAGGKSGEDNSSGADTGKNGNSGGQKSSGR